MAGKSSQAVRRIDSENHSVLKPFRPVFDMNDGVAPGALLAKLPIVILEKLLRALQARSAYGSARLQ